ncbi:hypothetical protein SCORR_v1c06080 [Spiroplasma corruscae]|uniref:Lipoprotein n=1 Tax=Spiroplasma corruscae TaxID=216934 RepID=A0A222EPF7_9MOLU|nr:hypothetical protein [Spiroplasma corruscae]ASP28380.1 hypothetical protein SCORR_v1c06080 [Spiroplasma corruscae]
MKKLLTICASVFITSQLPLMTISCTNPVTVENNLYNFYNKSIEKLKQSARLSTDFNNIKKEDINTKLEEWMKKELIPSNYSGYNLTIDKSTKPSSDIFLVDYKIISELNEPVSTFECEVDIFISIQDTWQSLNKLLSIIFPSVVYFYIDYD